MYVFNATLLSFRYVHNITYANYWLSFFCDLIMSVFHTPCLLTAPYNVVASRIVTRK